MTRYRTKRSRKLPRVYVLGIPLVLMAMTTAACNGSGSSSTNKGSVGDTLTVAVSDAPAPSLDPAINEAGGEYQPIAYDGLILWAPDGSYKPDLAVKWQVGPQNKSFTVTLRPGLKFSDGTALDAAALRTYYQYCLKVPGGGCASYFGADTKITVRGPDTLTFNFSRPIPDLTLLFTQLFSTGLPASPKAIAANTLAKTTAGAGQYVLDPSETVPGDHYTFAANPYYWNKPAIHWKKLVMRVISNPNTALAAVKTGQAQLAISQPVNSIAPAKDAGLTVSAPLILSTALFLVDRGGEKVKALGDVRVRQALNYAVNRQAVSQAVAGSYAKPLYQMATPVADSYNSALDNAYPYNPQKAKQLLAEAGYPNGFSFEAAAPATQGIDTFAQAMVGQYAAIGVKMDLHIMTPPDYFAAAPTGKYPVSAWNWGTLPSPVQYTILYGPDAKTANPLGARNVDIDRLYQEQTVASSPAEVASLGRQIQKILVDQAWFVPVIAQPLAQIYSPKITGINTMTARPFMNFPEVEPAS